MAFDATPVTVDNGELIDYTAAVRTTTAGKIVGCQIDIGTNETPSPVTPANPLPVISTTPSASVLTIGNIVSDGAVTAAAIEAAAGAAINLITYAAAMFLSVMIFNRLTADVEVSFDGGGSWMILPAGASPTVEFARDFRKIIQNVQVRKKSGVTTTGEDVIGWGKV